MTFSKDISGQGVIHFSIAVTLGIFFEKVNFPKYEGIYQFLGEPSNLPDFIKDYHVISLARNIDYWAKPDDRKLIRVVVNSVKSK